MIPDNARRLFEVPDDIAYLNCSYMSPQLRPVREAGERALAQCSRPWEIPPAAFFEEVEKSRDLFARLVGGEADGVALIPSVSYGIAVAAANVPVEKGSSIVVLEGQFPSNVYPWRELAGERGAKLVTVPRPPDHDWTGAVLAALDTGVAVVAVPNCHWTDGSLLDLVAIGERAREVGAAFVVDAIQSLGAHPFDVTGARPDFLVAAAYKWLLGPYGVGFMHVRGDHRNGRPIEHNWINRAGSEKFSDLSEYTSDFQPGARRYDVGERSNFILLPMATEALRHILDWGVENISETAGKLTDLIEEEAGKRGIETVPKERRCRHVIGLGLGPDAPEDLAARLAAEGVFVSVRGGSIRVSPHIYNDERDVARLFEVLDRTLSGTYPA
ncbi:aminotransferase class V-fold PLP-dependent enzyme [Rubrobacter indicoceani]|uniref:aminotransferase class V-fold PLP-dependent enzyme n=1 Tax=Rubrobacter indicoceani TaxID=2051957 RepID=UPI001F095D97|nr:aminotransferase class V-fold PLP-dependent enzyme [Rubrobacter indicoceani]